MGLELGFAAIMSLISAATAGVGTAVGIKQGMGAADRQKEAQKKAEQAANAKSQKSPNLNAILAASQAAAKGGLGSTMLTGPAGVNNASLGRTSLLG